MKIEDQVCTLEQAKRLKELGVEQKVLFQWKQNNVQTVVIDTPMAMWIEEYVPPVGNKFFAAFTVAELGVMLPEKDGLYTVRSIPSNEWVIADVYDEVYLDRKGFATEAEARAAMLIYLLENNLITAEEINKRFERT